MKTFLADNRVVPRETAPGVFLIGQYGTADKGIWILAQKHEAVILEMPEINPRKDSNALQIIRYFGRINNLEYRLITATHSHTDHFFSAGLFHAEFPDIPVIVHESFMYDFMPYQKYKYYITPLSLRKNTYKPTLMLKIKNDIIPLHLFNRPVFSIKLSGEPLHLIHAPRHSSSDTMVIFRGTMISGDWRIGPGDPNYSRISPETVNRSIDTLMDFSRKKNYIIQRIFSSHADNFLHNIDFFQIMQSSRP